MFRFSSKLSSLLSYISMQSSLSSSVRFSVIRTKCCFDVRKVLGDLKPSGQIGDLHSRTYPLTHRFRADLCMFDWLMELVLPQCQKSIPLQVYFGQERGKWLVALLILDAVHLFLNIVWLTWTLFGLLEHCLAHLNIVWLTWTLFGLLEHCLAYLNIVWLTWTRRRGCWCEGVL